MTTVHDAEELEREAIREAARLLRPRVELRAAPIDGRAALRVDLPRGARGRPPEVLTWMHDNGMGRAEQPVAKLVRHDRLGADYVLVDTQAARDLQELVRDGLQPTFRPMARLGGGWSRTGHVTFEDGHRYTRTRRQMEPSRIDDPVPDDFPMPY